MKKILLMVAGVVLAAPFFVSAQTAGLTDQFAQSTDSCVNLTYNMSYRSRDAQTNGQVSDLQDFLSTNGYLASEPTGYYGLMTVTAVKKFQSAVLGASSLTPGYGGVGPLTRAKIKAMTCGDTTTTTTTTTTPTTLQTTQTTQSATNLPAGCTSFSGYSSVTGNSCSAQTVSTTAVSATIDQSSLADFATYPTFTGTVTGVSSVRIRVVQNSTGNDLVVPALVYVTDGRWSFRAGTEAPRGNYTVNVIKPGTEDLLAKSVYTESVTNTITITTIGSITNLTQPGITTTVKGNSGVDVVNLLVAGASLDGTQLGLGIDRIRVPGNFNNYTRTYSGNVVTLTRASGPYTEIIKFLGGSATAYDDIIFNAGLAKSIDILNFVNGTAGVPVLTAVTTEQSISSTPTVNIVASPASITVGQSAILTATVNNVTSCGGLSQNYDSGWIKNLSNNTYTKTVSPTTNANYSINCRNSAGVSVAADNISINVTEPVAGVAPSTAAVAPTLTLSATTTITITTIGSITNLTQPGITTTVKGNSGVDIVNVSAGASLDFTQAGLGMDEIHLAGNFSDYTKTYGGSVVTMTRIVGVYIETIKFLGGSATAYDRIYFANGSAPSVYILDFLKGLAPTVILALNTANQPQLASVIDAFAQAPASATAPAWAYTWTRNLEVNSPYADDVSALQTALIKEGVYAGDVTGGFYSQTYLAVKALQAKYGIESTGFVGPTTRAKLNELY